jgi:uncharacterized RDD family membrane protein YckC
MTETIIPTTPATPSGPDPAIWAYAGFWLRFWAFLIDRMILFFITLFVLVPLTLVAGVGRMIAVPGAMMVDWQNYIDPSIYLKVMVIDWLYFALMESSGWQATFGKRAMGLAVMDLAGNRIGFGRASGRFFAKIISATIFMIGYIMVAFTPKKQALHDIIADTLVMRKK